MVISLSRKKDEIVSWIQEKIREFGKNVPKQITEEDSIADFGISSAYAIILIEQLKEYADCDINAKDLWVYPTIEKFAEYVESCSGKAKETSKKEEFKKEEIVEHTESTKDTLDDKVAIIGMACRFPCAKTPQEFWDVLLEGKDCITTRKFGEREFSGGFIEDVDQFDNEFFRILPREAELMDPQQRLLLQVSWEAFEDAGIIPKDYNGKEVGVYVGISSNDYANELMYNNLNDELYTVTGNAHSIAANRLSYFYNFTGPSLAVDTACSSSLVALHTASLGIMNNEAELAVVAGVNLILNNQITDVFHKAKMLSPDERCRTFDQEANGYVRGEGVGVVILKSLKKAIEDNDRIYSIVLGSAVNQDGRSNGLTAPNSSSQIAVMKKAMRVAKVSPSEIQYVEAHGTGTNLGDPIEAHSLGEAIGKYKEDKLKIGSVKSNIGHLEAAAGIAGVMKTALCIYNHKLVPSIHYHTMNPQIDGESLSLEVQTSIEEWAPVDRRVAGISSFGFGGTNAHILLGEYQEEIEESSKEKNKKEYYVLPVSGFTENSLKSNAGAYKDWLRMSGDEGLDKLGGVLGTRRTQFQNRIAIVSQSAEAAETKLEDVAQGQSGAGIIRSLGVDIEKPKVAFIFSGQGPGELFWNGELLQNKDFREELDRCDAIFQSYSGWSVVEVIEGTSSRTFENTCTSQPVVFCIQVALASMLKKYGVVPEAVVGHSLGEVAAAYVSGRLTLEDAIKVVYNRSVIMEELKGTGRMLSVMVSEEQAMQIIADSGYEEDVKVSVVNAKNSCVLSGSEELLNSMKAVLEEKGIRSTFLGVDYPFHGCQARELDKPIRAKLRTLRVRPQKCEVYAAVTGEKADAHTFGGRYWGEQVYSAVQFYKVMQNMMQDGYNVFVELNAQPLLTAYIKQMTRDNGIESIVLPVLQKRMTQDESIAHLLGTMYVNHINVDWKGYYGEVSPKFNGPYYYWDQKHFWFKKSEGKRCQVSHYEEVKQEANHVQAKQEQNVLDKIRAAKSKEEQYELVEQFVKKQIAGVFHMEVEQIKSDVNLLQLGMDSLMAYDIKNIIDHQFLCDFPVIQFISGAEVNTVVRCLMENCIDNQVSLPESDKEMVVGEELELSYMQKSLWMIYKNDSENRAYNQHFCADITGKVDMNAMKMAIKQLLIENRELCARFDEVDSKVEKFYCEPEELTPFHFEESRIYSDEEIEDQIDSLSRTSFVLEEGNLFETYFFRKQDGYTLFVRAHHMVIDLGSILVLLKELFEHYNRIAQGEELPIVNKRTYDELVQEQKNFVESEQGKEQGAYWQKALSGTLPVVDLAMKKRPDKVTYHGSCYMSSLDKKLSNDLRMLAREYSVTVNTLLYSAYFLLVNRYTGEEDIIIGSSASLRGAMNYKDVVGHMVNLLPVRMEVKGEQSFKEFIDYARQVMIDSLTNQMYPYAKIMEDIQPVVGQGFSPIVQIAFSQEAIGGDNSGIAKFIMGHDHESNFSELSFSARKVDVHYAPYDLLLMTEVSGESISLTWQYNTALFSAKDMERMAEHFANLLYAISQNNDQPMGTYPMLTAQEEQILFNEFNERKIPYDGRMFCEEFEKIVDMYPENIAVSMHDTKETYRQFNEKINQTARYLLSKGVKKGDFIGVSLVKSVPVMEFLMAILKIGCVYIPIDPEYPESRITYIINHAQIKRVVVNEGCQYDEWDVEGCEFDTIESIVTARSQFDTTNLDTITIEPHDLAYIIFTSGTTGTPKGVMIEHIGICNMVDGLNEGFEVGPNSKVLQFASLSFDASIAEIFITFMCGAELVLRRKEEILPDGGLESVLKTCEITEVILTPSVLMLANPEGITKLRTVLSAGESCSPEVLNKWAEGRRFVNAYGPTESTVCASLKVCRPGEDITIGKAITKTKLYVVDKFMNPVPIGMPGELCISTIGLARGYFKNEELTNDKFVDNTLDSDGYEKIYKTSDVVRLNKEGNIHFCGRKDNQVKIRGFRIELDEIESVLGRYQEVKEAAVIVKEISGEKVLVAFLATDSEAADYLGDAKQYVRKFVPHYMVPAHFIRLKNFPHSVSGKIDRKALEAIDVQVEAEQVDESKMTDLQKKIRRIWCNALHYNGITLHDDFYELGGHSLTAAQVRAEIQKEFSVRIEMNDIFEHSLLEDFCHIISSRMQDTDGSSYKSIQKLGEKTFIPVTYAQNRLLFVSKMSKDSSEYNISGDLNLTGNLDISLFQRSFELLVERHDILHTVFFQDNKRFYQKVLSDYDNIKLEVIELCGCTPDSEEVNKVLTQIKKTPFDLEKGPLIRAGLVKLSETQYILGFAVHHIISDGWSVALMVDEWSEIYNALQEERKPNLSEDSIQFSDYVIWQSEHIQGEYLEEIEDYWVSKMKGAQNAILQLPTDYKRPARQTNHGDIVYHTIGKEVKESLGDICKARQSTMFMVLFSAWNILLSKITNEYDINIGVPVAGRERSETEQILGMFINMVVLRTSYSSSISYYELLEAVKKDSIESMERQDIPFERLVELLNPARNLMYTPIFQIMFNMLSVKSPEFKLHDVTATDRVQSEVDAKYDITLYAKEETDGIELQLVYNTDIFSKEHMKQLLNQYEYLLAQIAKKPEGKVKDFTLFKEEQWNQMQAQLDHGTIQDYQPIHELVSRAVEEYGERIAVGSADSQMTYHQLWENAMKIASNLEASYRGDCVVIYAERSSALVELVLACATTGKTFAIIDSNYPQERIIGMLEQIAFSCFVDITKGKQVPEKLKEYVDQNGRYCSEEEIKNGKAEDVTLQSDGYYIMFTSGTTGKPNAIKSRIDCISHFLAWYLKKFQVGREDQFSMLSGVGHDPIMRDIFVPLCAGACIQVPTPEQVMIPESLYHWLMVKKITVIHQTPSILKLMDGHQLEQVRLVCFGGERLTSWDLDMARTVFPQAKLINCYGATETPQIMSYFDATEFQGNQVPVGQGIDDVEILVLDEEKKRTGMYQVGEVVIKTKYLSEGYLNNEKLNESKILSTDNSDERIYRTGDVGYYDENGFVVVTGRKDMQLKVRGFRVEPEEIEQILKRVSGAKDVKVVVNGKGKLIAFLAEAPQEIESKSVLNQCLATELPSYMIPEKYCQLEKIPLTRNGKTDYKALLELEPMEKETAKADFNSTEAVVAEIWKESLGLETVDLDSNFFEIGGHSFLLMEMYEKLSERLPKQFEMVELFRYPTIRTFSSYIESCGNEGTDISEVKQTVDKKKEALKAMRQKKRGKRT